MALYSIKAVLLHIWITLRETYENLAFILNRKNYKKHEWIILADLKLVSLFK